MKHISTSITLFLFILPFSKLVAKEPQESAEDSKALTTDEIIRAEVIGKLGIPLGTCVDIQATVEAARKPTSKQNSGKYFLKITHVKGNKLIEQFYKGSQARIYDRLNSLPLKKKNKMQLFMCLIDKLIQS